MVHWGALFGEMPVRETGKQDDVELCVVCQPTGALSLGWSFAAAAAKLLQSCPTLCDPIDGSPPGSPIPGIL